MSTVIPPPPKVGSKFKNRFGQIFQVRAIVDFHKKTGQYVVVLRSGNRGRWHYSTDSCWGFAYGLLTPAKKTKEKVA